MGSFSILDILILFAKSKNKLAVHFLCVSALAVGISFLIPKSYKATTMFLPPRNERGNSNPFNIGVSFDLGGSSDFLNEQIESIVLSRTLLEEVVHRFNLEKVYKTMKFKNSLERAVKELKGSVKLKDDVLSGLTQQMIVSYSLSVVDKNPILAAGIANYMVELLHKTMNSLSHVQEAYIVKFIQSRLDSVSATQDSVRFTLKQFQKAHKIYSTTMNDQIRGTIEIVAELKKQTILAEVERSLLMVENERGNREVLIADKKVSDLKSKMDELENSEKPGAIPPLSSSIDVSHQYFEMMRDLDIQIRLQSLLRQQLEEARIKNERRVPIVRVVDPAVPPIGKNFPKKSIVVLIIVSVYMFGLITYILAGFGLEFSSNEVKDKIRNLKLSLSMIRKDNYLS